MSKINAKNYDVALKLFKSEAADSIEEFFDGMGPEDMESKRAVIDLLYKATDFEEAEEVLKDQMGYYEDMISTEYQHTLARLVGMKKKELFVEVI